MRALPSSRALAAVLAALLTVTTAGGPGLAAAEKVSFGIGGGFASGRYAAERGEIEDSTGAYAVFLFRSKRGVLARAAISFGDFRGTGTEGSIDIGTLRMDLSAGYVFRDGAVVRPFVHGGVVLLSLSVPSAGGGALVEDEAYGLTVGAGLLAMRGRHGVYLDLAYDPDLSVTTWSAGDFVFDHTELHVGYVWVSD
jgi:hypothetical protein